MAQQHQDEMQRRAILDIARGGGYGFASSLGETNMLFEYKVVPAPKKAKSARGVKGGPAKFAHSITALMNDMAQDGWEYLRADTLPMEERQGLTKKTVNYHSLLVFRRQLVADARAEPVLTAPIHQEEEPEAEYYYEEAPADPHDDGHVYVDDPQDPDPSPRKGKLAAE